MPRIAPPGKEKAKVDFMLKLMKQKGWLPATPTKKKR
jgi:hypothetical protein